MKEKGRLESQHSLTQRVEDSLKNHWRIERFVFFGEYAEHPNGKMSFFNKIRNENADLLYYPESPEYNLKYGIVSAIAFKVMPLEVGKIYRFEAKINPDEKFIEKQPFVFDAQNFREADTRITERLQRERLIRDIFKRTGYSPTDSLNIANALRNFQLELYTKTERFVFEILQNADDFPIKPDEAVSINFETLAENLLITHNGRPFTEKDVRSICSIGDSAKAKDESATGYKGIGFKSVFTHSSRVFIYSGGYSFCFDSEYGSYNNFDSLFREFSDDKHYADKGKYIGKDNVPWQLRPIWREQFRFPYEVQREGHFFQSNVSFCLEFGSKNILEFNQQITKLFNEPRFLLFLRNIADVQIKVSGTNLRFQRTEIGNEIVKLQGGTTEKIYTKYTSAKIDVTSKEVDFRDDPKIPQKLKEANSITVSFAALLEENRVIRDDESVIFTYLPTEDNAYDFPFLVNSDFVTTSNREQIQPDNKWNKFVMEHVGVQVFHWICSIVQNEDIDINSAYEVLPERFEKEGEIYDSFNDGFTTAIEEIAFIPDHTNTLQKLEDILIDETGLVELLGADEFKKTTGIEQVLIHPDLSSNTRIYELIKSEDKGSIFTKSDLEDWIKSDNVTWFENERNNIEFLKLLIKNVWTDFTKDYAIVLDQHGELYAADELYDDFGDDLDKLSWLPIKYVNPAIKSAVKLSDLPVKKYSPKVFVLTDIIDSSRRVVVNDLLEEKDNNVKFYNYLSEYQDLLTPKEDFWKGNKGLNYFKVLGINDVIITSTECSVYFYDEELEDLHNTKVLPEDFVNVLSPVFCEENVGNKWESFWKKFGIKQYLLADFAKAEMQQSANVIFKYYEDLIEGQEDNIEFLVEAITANTTLWEYLHAVKPELTDNEKADFVTELRKFPVFTTDFKVKQIADCFLPEAYTGTDYLEEVHKQFEDMNMSFVSDLYLENKVLTKSTWKSWLSESGCKVDAEGLLERVLYSIESLHEDNHVGILKLLHKNRKSISEEKYDEIKEKLPVKMQDGTFATFSDKPLISGSLLETDFLTTVLPSIAVTNFISADYGGKKSWKEFFTKLGAICLETEAEAIDYKIDYLLENQDEIITVDNHISIVQELKELYKEDLITKEQLTKLHSLKLSLGSDNFLEAEKCHFGSVYNPKLDLQKLLPEEYRPDIFINNEYALKIIDSKSFFKIIGVKDNFYVVEIPVVRRNELDIAYRSLIDLTQKSVQRSAQHHGSHHKIENFKVFPYFEYVKNVYDVAVLFWQEINRNSSIVKAIFSTVKYEYFQFNVSIVSYPHFQLKNYSAIPSKDGQLRKPADIFSNGISRYAADDAQVSEIELSKTTFGEVGLEQLLGFIQEVSPSIVLRKILKDQQAGKKITKESWRLLIENQKNNFDAALVVEFKESGKLINQLGELKPCKELYYLTYNIGIGNNEWLIRDDLRKLAEVFSIKELSKDDFTFKPVNKKLDSLFKNRLVERLKFLAFIEVSDNYSELAEQWSEKVSICTFYTVDKILFSSENDLIENNQKKFHKENHAVYYVGSWDGSRAVEIFNFFKNDLLGLIKIEIDLLKDLLIWSETEILAYFDERNINYPEEWKPEIVEPESRDTIKYQDLKNPIISYVAEEDTVSEKVVSLTISSGIEKELQKQVNNEAKSRAHDWLKKNKYDLTNAEISFYRFINVCSLADSVNYTVIVKSFINGILYLTPQDWQDLDKDTCFLLVVRGQEPIHIRDCESLLTAYSRTLFRVNNREQEAIKIGLDGLCDSFEFIKTAQLIFLDEEAKYQDIREREELLDSEKDGIVERTSTNIDDEL